MTRTCANCARDMLIAGRGLCGACYSYLARHGRQRPADGDGRLKPGPSPRYTQCVDCDAVPAIAFGLCRRCYQRRRDHEGLSRYMDVSPLIASEARLRRSLTLVGALADCRHPGLAPAVLDTIRGVTDGALAHYQYRR